MRRTPMAVGACLMVLVVLDAGAQPAGTADSDAGLRIVTRSEVRVVPGAAGHSDEVARILAARRQAAPPDGFYSSTIYVEGSAIRIEWSAPADAPVTICPAGTGICHTVSYR